MWQAYSKYSAIQLSDATHAEGTPWHKVATQNNLETNKHLEINDAIIKAYFQELKQKMEGN